MTAAVPVTAAGIRANLGDIVVGGGELGEPFIFYTVHVGGSLWTGHLSELAWVHLSVWVHSSGDTWSD